MASAVTATEFAGLLKQWYLEFGESELLNEFPLLSAVKKNEKVGGSSLLQAVAMNATSASRRQTTFAASIAGTAQVGSVQFNIPFVRNYMTSEIDGLLFGQSDAGSQASFISAFEEQLVEDIRLLKQSLAIQLYRDGTGAVTTLASTANVSATYVALANASDVNMFNVGEQVVLVNVTSSAGSTIKVGSATIADIDTSAGTLGFTTPLNTSITLAVAGDFIFKAASDAQNGASAPVVMTGLDGWCPPTTASLTASFHGVIRSNYGRRGLAGLYVPNTQQGTIAEQLINAVAKFQAQGGVVKAIYMHPDDLASFCNAAQSQVWRDDSGSTTTIGFKSIELITSRGAVKTIADLCCPKGRAYALDTDNVVLCSVGPFIRPLDQDGHGLLMRKYNADSVEMRHGFYGNLTVKMPQRSVCSIQL